MALVLDYDPITPCPLRFEEILDKIEYERAALEHRLVYNTGLELSIHLSIYNCGEQFAQAACVVGWHYEQYEENGTVRNRWYQSTNTPGGHTTAFLSTP